MSETKPSQIIMLGLGLEVKGGISSVEKLILEQGIPEMKLKHISTLEEGSLVKRILVFKQAIANLLWTLYKEKAHLIHIHFAARGSSFRTLILIVISLVFRKPIVLHAHGSGYDIFYSNLPLWIQQITNYLFCRCSLLIALSNSWKKYYVTNLGLEEEKVLVLANPVKLPSQIQYLKDPNSEDFNNINFLFLGRIGQRKGSFELIRAFAQIPSQQRSQASLTMAGDGDVEQARNLVKDLDLVDQITILDWVNSEERDVLLAKSDVFVLPSYAEGLPMAIIEAMSFGLPVITTPVGGIPELISHGNNGLLIEPGIIQELSSAMQSLIKNEDMRNSLGVESKEHVASLDIQKYCLSLKSIYQDLISI